MMATDTSQRSSLKEFLASIATISGDLSNITAPPFVLATQSTTELPSYWAEHPDVFSAPCTGSTPGLRALLVLKWFLISLHRQQYGGRPESAGVKKPLNAFLGELFIAIFDSPGSSSASASATTTLVSEQVSHHPPITGCHLANPTAGIRAEGYACQRITFNGAVHIKQTGHAIVTIQNPPNGPEETHLIPLPDVKVSGLLTGNPYPELTGHYELASSAGPLSAVDFSGRRALGLGGERHHVHAAVFAARDRADTLFEIEGRWDGELVVTDAHGAEVERFDVHDFAQVAPGVPARDAQSPWESRRAWGGVVDALGRGDMQGTVDAKGVLEEAQRARRRREEGEGAEWRPNFFKRVDGDEGFARLVAGSSTAEEWAASSRSCGFWKFDEDAWAAAQRPYRDGAPWE